jgi:Protein of unknown function (DUF1552)
MNDSPLNTHYSPLTSQRISRRTILRGAGAAVALPWLEAMVPDAALAQSVARGAAAPKRMAFFYVPNGIHMADWVPAQVGARFDMPPTLKALLPYRDQLTVLTGLAQHNAEALGDGPGDHARSLACFLTGVHPLKTDGAGIRVGISVDQVAAQKLGRHTRLPSLELGIERGAQSGNCDSGYSCAYSSNISWSGPNMPMAKEINPRLVFDRLFGVETRHVSAAEQKKAQFYRKSVLDFVKDDAERLHSRVSKNDQRKLDEYLTAIRQVELQVAEAASASARRPDGAARPEGIPDDLGAHIKLMFDLITLAFQCDVTRICTFMFANEGSNRNYPSINVGDGHHDLSHHGGDTKKHEKLKVINRFHIEQFAYLIGKLQSIREGEASLLDSSMIVYGSGISDGDRHNHDDLPVLLLGKGGGAIRPGRHLKVTPQPLNNLFLAMLERMGVSLNRLGDSTGALSGLNG